MSFKNKLQEYFQKLGSDLPRYTYTRIGGEDHAPKWECQVEIAPNHITALCCYMSEVKSSKKKASESAAKNASEALGLGASNLYIETSVGISRFPRERYSSYSTFYLLDIENCPKSYAELCERRVLEEDDIVIAFHSKNTVHLYYKVMQDELKYGFPIKFYKAQSAHKDAADVRMSMFVGEIIGFAQGIQHQKFAPDCCITHSIEEDKILSNIERGVPIRFVIFTNDHFGEALADIINTYPCDESERVSFISEVYHHVSEII